MSAEVVDIATRKRAVMHANETAEDAVLACAYYEPASIDEALDVVTPADFTAARTRLIWTSMLRLHAASAPVDLSTITADLRAHGDLERIGGELAVLTIGEMCPTPATIEHHARIVRGCARTRAIVGALQRALALANEPIPDVDAFGSDVETRIVEAVRDRASVAGPVVMRDAVIETVEHILEGYERVRRGEPAHDAIAPRWTGLRSILGGGFRPGELHLVAGRPGMGKSAVGLDLALEFAAQSPGILFSLEMSRDELVRRALASEGRIDGSRLRTLGLSADDHRRMQSAGSSLSRLAASIDDTAAATLTHVRAAARRVKARGGLGWLVIDYLQLMRTDRDHRSREGEVGEISRGLKRLAKELAVPVVALAQLNRDAEKRAGAAARPRLADLRESGSLEQDADTVIFVDRPEMRMPEDPMLRGVAELIVGKQRSGPTGSVKMRYVHEFTRFEDCDDLREPTRDGAWAPSERGDFDD